MDQPIVYVGGKRRIAPEVWKRFGDVHVYLEPFAGGLGVLLGRPEHHKGHIEIANDSDLAVLNFWRCVRVCPMAVVQEAERLRHAVEIRAAYSNAMETLKSRVDLFKTRVSYCEPQAAGLWAFAHNSAMFPTSLHTGGGPAKPYSHVQGNLDISNLLELQSRFVEVAFDVGDWTETFKRALGFGVRNGGDRWGDIGIFCDPPYSAGTRKTRMYAHDKPSVASECAQACRDLAVEHPALRMALCGVAGEHDDLLVGWSVYDWSTKTGVSERVWFSPGCNNETQVASFEAIFEDGFWEE
jgi:site-specific DNA-adenine methylase